MMRLRGKLTKWKDDRGFGFITPIRGGEQVFVHIKAFTNQLRRPVGPVHSLLSKCFITRRRRAYSKSPFG